MWTAHTTGSKPLALLAYPCKLIAVAKGTNQKGLLFTLDFCIALIVLMLMTFLTFFAIVRVAETRHEQIRLFEQKRNILFVDSLLKRGIDENGFAKVSDEQKRVLENNIDDVEKAVEKNLARIIENKVVEIKLDGQKIFEASNKCKETLAVKRGISTQGKFALLEVKFCNDQQ